jgi:hypothetical protein
MRVNAGVNTSAESLRTWPNAKAASYRDSEPTGTSPKPSITTRNEGVPGSSPGVGFIKAPNVYGRFLLSWDWTGSGAGPVRDPSVTYSCRSVLLAYGRSAKPAANIAKGNPSRLSAGWVRSFLRLRVGILAC